MASLRMLAFDHEGRPLRFDTWLNDLQLYLLSDLRDTVSLFDHTSGAAPAPPDTADSETRSLWLNHDTAAHLAIRNHLPLAECAHFGQHRTAQTLYDAGHPIQFDTWLDDLQLYLLSGSRDSVSLFDHTSGAAPAPPATADSATRSQWLTRDAAACLAIRNHLPLAERAHFGQHRTALALYDAVVVRYSMPTTAALGRLLLPYLLPELSAFATLEDLVSHLCTSNARYRAALPAEFLAKNPPPMGAPPPPLLPPTPLLLLLTSLVLRTSGLLLLVRSTTGARARVAGVVAVAAGVVVGAAVEVVEAVEVVVVMGVVVGVGALVESVVAAAGVAVVAAVGVVAVGLELHSVEVWEVARGSSSSVRARSRRQSSFTCGKPQTQHRCFSCLDDAWRAKFGDEAERPRWAELLRSGVVIFDLDYDAILATIYALSVTAEGDCYLCVPPDPGIEAAVLGARESALPIPRLLRPSTPLHLIHVPHAISFAIAPPSPLRGPSRCPFLHCSPVSGCSVRLTVRSSPPVFLYKLGEYSCPPGCDGHYHHSWGSACVNLHVYTDGPSPGHAHSSARVDSVHTGY
ncbi:unnamed protein product [Closterium sp. NIES-53]